MRKLSDTMDKHLYNLILKQDVRKIIEFYSINAEKIKFQYDNNPKNQANIVAKWHNKQ